MKKTYLIKDQGKGLVENLTPDKLFDIANSGSSNETDPIFSASPSATITNSDISNWNSKLSAEIDTLESVVNRGNYSPRYISFTRDASTNQGAVDGAIGFNSTTKNFIFGTINENQTGTYNLNFGSGNGIKFTSAQKNTNVGNGAGNYLTTGSYNSIFGYNAAYALNTGTENSIMGYLAGQGDVNGSSYSYSTILGSRAGFKSINGKYNTFVGYTAGYNNTIGDYNTFTGSYSGYNNTSGFFNTFYGGTTGAIIKNGNSNVLLGYGAAGAKNQTPTVASNRNIYIGRLAGTGVQGDNNVFIGTQAGFVPGTGTLAVYNNKLIIHNRNGFIDDETSATATTNAEDTFSTGLILGDFAVRWVKFNGSLIVNPTYLTADNTYTKNVVAKPDGTFGIENKISVPAPPTTGNYILKSINGVIQWIA